MDEWSLGSIVRRTVDTATQIQRERDELRALLVPLLDYPFDAGVNYLCHFCEWEEDDGHAPDCPVHRKDELLGRHGASRQATRRATS